MKHAPMRHAPSIKSFESAGFSREQAKAARAIIRDEIKPEEYQSVRKWIDSCYNLPSLTERKMEALNEILRGYGVETIWPKGQSANDCIGHPRADYVNLGETYQTTLLYDYRSGQYRLISWGDFVEVNRLY